MSTPSSLLHGLIALFLTSGFALALGDGSSHHGPAGRHGAPSGRTSILKADTTDEWDSDVVKVPRSAPAGAGAGGGS